jgi:hypothetical protein
MHLQVLTLRAELSQNDATKLRLALIDRRLKDASVNSVSPHPIQLTIGRRQRKAETTKRNIKTAPSADSRLTEIGFDDRISKERGYTQIYTTRAATVKRTTPENVKSFVDPDYHGHITTLLIFVTFAF